MNLSLIKKARAPNIRGMVLSELLIALAVSTLLITAILGALITTQKFYASNIAGQNFQRDANIILQKIIKGEPETGGTFRLSEATSYSLVSISEIHFLGTDGKTRWYQLSADGASILYHHPVGGAVQDKVIYKAPIGSALTIRFWIPAGAQYANIDIGIDVGLSQTINGTPVSGSATTMVLLRNHST